MTVTESVCLFLVSYILSYIFCLLYWDNVHHAAAERRFIQPFLLFLTSVPFALLCGFRGEIVGYDTEANIIGYLDMKFGLGEITNSGFNYIYIYARYIAYNVFGKDNIGAWFFVMATVPLMCVNYVMVHYARRRSHYVLGCLLFLLYLSPIMMDQSRQFIGIGIILIAFYHLQHNKTWHFYLLTVMASLIHESCIIMFLFPLLCNRYIENSWLRKWIPLIVIILSFFALQYLVSIIYSYLPTKFAYINEQAKEQVSFGYAWIVDLAPMLCAMFVYYRYRMNRVNSKLPLELCALSAFPFRLAGYHSFFIMRLSYYGEAVCIILLLEVLSQMPHGKASFWAFVCLIVFFLHWYIDFVILGLNGVIPYEFS